MTGINRTFDKAGPEKPKQLRKNAKKALIFVLIFALLGGIGIGVGLHVKSKESDTISDFSKEGNKDTDLVKQFFIKILGSQ